jgi:hypothetical protein
MVRSVTRVHRNPASRTGLSWPQANLVIALVMLLAYVGYALTVLLAPAQVASGTSDWKGDPVQSHYRDWRP